MRLSGWSLICNEPSRMLSSLYSNEMFVTSRNTCRRMSCASSSHHIERPTCSMISATKSFTDVGSASSAVIWRL